MKNTYRLYGAVAALVVLQSTSAFADILITANRIAKTAIPADTVVNVPLRQANDSFVAKFRTTRDNQTVVVQYNAECLMNSPSRKGWLHVGIFIDGINIRPTNDGNAMCSGADLTAAGTGNWVSAVVTGVYPVPTAGVHDVTVKAILQGNEATDSGALDDSVLVVFN